MSRRTRPAAAAAAAPAGATADLRALARTAARELTAALCEPPPDDTAGRDALVEDQQKVKSVWFKRLEEILRGLAGDLLRAGRPGREVNELVEGVRGPLARMTLVGWPHNPLAGTPVWRGHDGAEWRVVAYEQYAADCQIHAHESLAPLREDTLRAVDAVETVWRALCAAGPAAPKKVPKRGRKPHDPSNAEVRRLLKLREDWQAARRQGTRTYDDFARIRNLDPGTVREELERARGTERRAKQRRTK
jgi:hypothetical protein